MDNDIVYTATCLFGLEGLVGEEIDALGYKRIETIDGRVTFTGNTAAIARCNINLRFAERVLINLGSFKALSFDELFEGTKALPWESWIGNGDAFPVKGHAIKSQLYSIPDCQSIIKKAVATRLSSIYNSSWLEESGAKYQIEFFILKDVATLMIDTSGASLHKRGYRQSYSASDAPLRETLAAAIAKFSRPREEVLFWDPFCGSGTIAIEAALIMSNRAPGLYRRFAAEQFKQPLPKTWKAARDEARAAIITDSKFQAYASDINPACIGMTNENIEKAKVENLVKAFPQDALTIETEGRRGTIVCNPPYGERLMNKSEADQLYVDMGVHFKTLDRWQIYVLTSSDDFQRLFDRRADKIRKLYNGMIPCHFYQFFKGSKI